MGFTGPLSALDDDSLAGAWSAADVDDPAVFDTYMTEFRRREQAERLARARKRLAEIRNEGEIAAHAQFLEASDWCRGRLLSREGVADGIREADLWRMPWHQAARYCSEELGEFFEHVSPRITAADYVRVRAAEARMARSQAIDAAGPVPAVSDEYSNEESDSDERDADGAGLAGDEPGALRRDAAAEDPEVSAGAGWPVPGGGRGHAEGAEAGPDGTGARRSAGPVRPAGRVSVMQPTFTTFADIEPLPSEPLWPGYWPRGEVVGWYGEGGIGKGRSELDLAARVTRGDPMPFCTGRTRPGSAILILPEDHAQEQVRPRLDAAGADVSRVVDMTRLQTGARFKLSASPTKDGDIGLLRGCIETLRSTCAACRVPMAAGRCPQCGGSEDMNPRLVIIDPLSALIGYGSISTVAGARRAIEPLQDVAQSTGVTILLVMHSTKDGQLQGSAGVRQALRVLYKVTKDVNPLVRVISLDKANNQGETPDAKFTLEGTEAGVRVVWLDRQEQDKRSRAWRSVPPAPAPAAARQYAALLSVRQPGQGRAETLILGQYEAAGRGAELARLRCESHRLFNPDAGWEPAGDESLSRYQTRDGSQIQFAVADLANY